MLQTYYVILLILDKDFNEYKVKGQSIMNPEIKPTVNHKNFNCFDNRVNNLEWATHLEQSNHKKER
jgi:hypothetical protein